MAITISARLRKLFAIAMRDYGGVNTQVRIQTNGGSNLISFPLVRTASPSPFDPLVNIANQSGNATGSGVAAQIMFQTITPSTVFMYATVTALGGGGDIEMADTNITIGDPLALVDLVYEVGA